MKFFQVDYLTISVAWCSVLFLTRFDTFLWHFYDWSILRHIVCFNVELEFPKRVLAKPRPGKLLRKRMTEVGPLIYKYFQIRNHLPYEEEVPLARISNNDIHLSRLSKWMNTLSFCSWRVCPPLQPTTVKFK